MPELVIGPLLRYVGETDATVWVETDAPCEVTVLGCSDRTFHVAGHHYALLHVDGLEPGSTTPYEVALDGERRWPEPGSPLPPCAIRTYGGGPVSVVFGSCRLSLPHEPPYTLSKDEHERGRELDALHAMALRLMECPPEAQPDLLLLLGDQVYADEVSPETRAFVEARRGPDSSAPPDQVADFEEYTRLYRESWTDPTIRWLLSTVPAAMIFDDHDVHDDWNTSIAWLLKMRAKDWWDERITGALMSYWIYQHLGNLSPREIAEDTLLAEVREADDGASVLRPFARRADRETDGTRWSYHRDIGSTRLVVIDSRAGRVLAEDGTRSMLDPDEWDWLEEQASGGFDHLLLATSLPYLLGRGMHHLEAWNEAVCAGAWGPAARGPGEWLRQALDLEHWAAFNDSFARLTELIRSVAAAERGEAPASITVLSGDVHHAYVAEAGFPRGSGVRSAVHQAVCSPVRNPLEAKERRVMRLGASSGFARVAHRLARSAGVRDPRIGWRYCEGPVFDNQIATVRHDGHSSHLMIEKAVPGAAPGRPGLEPSVERRLA